MVVKNQQFNGVTADNMICIVIALHDLRVCVLPIHYVTFEWNLVLEGFDMTNLPTATRHASQNHSSTQHNMWHRNYDVYTHYKSWYTILQRPQNLYLPQGEFIRSQRYFCTDIWRTLVVRTLVALCSDKNTVQDNLDKRAACNHKIAIDCVLNITYSWQAPGATQILKSSARTVRCLLAVPV